MDTVNFLSSLPEHMLAFWRANRYNEDTNLSLYSHMPERRAALTCGVDLHNAVCRKGAESERTAVVATRFASFARMETVTVAGLKANKSVTRNSRCRRLGRWIARAPRKAHMYAHRIDFKSRFLPLCRNRLCCILKSLLMQYDREYQAVSGGEM